MGGLWDSVAKILRSFNLNIQEKFKYSAFFLHIHASIKFSRSEESQGKETNERTS